VTLTARDVAEITKLLEESSFDELYLELDGVKLSLKRGAAAEGRCGNNSGGAIRPPQTSQAASAGASLPATAQAAPAGAPASQSGTASTLHATPAPIPAAADPNVHNLSAPLLGTFYRAPKPGAPPYVEVGSQVEEDTIVGIIEVMKLMNTVRAGARGRVIEIAARDGALVEYGETLLRIGKTS
jgi:acetyl-CoA carboxylase biotin carboxyl carrier protein